MVRRSFVRQITPQVKRYSMQFRKLPLWQRICLILLSVMIIQAMVPTGSASWLARLDGRLLIGQGKAEIAAQYTENMQGIEIGFNDKTTVVTPEDLGWEIDREATLQKIPTVSFRSKLVPLGVVYKLLTPASVHSSINRDSRKQLAAASRLINQYSVVASNASATIDGKGALNVTADKPGLRYSLIELNDRLTEAKVYGDAHIQLRAKQYDAEVRSDDFKDVAKHAATLKTRTLGVKIGNSTFTMRPKDYLSRLQVSGESKDTMQLRFQETSLDALLAKWGKNYDVQPGVTHITYVDGVETARRTGDNGKIIDKTKATQALQSWLMRPSDQVLALEMKTVYPRVQESRSYSATSAGLHARLAEWNAAHGGDYRVAVQELGGRRRSAGIAEQKPTVTASTYKLYVAYAAYKLAERGTMSLNDLVGDKSIEECIGRAIVYSDNDCAKAIGLKIGWANCEAMLHTAGFDSVKLNNYDSSGTLSGEKMAHAADLADFLQRLNAGSLLNSDHTATLLGYMKRQVYRQGIPAGSSGAAVADKVGFLGGYTHDAGIVYAPSGNYVLVIMSSQGNNWGNLKDLSQVVYDFFN